jgi:hypothetical protein
MAGAFTHMILVAQAIDNLPNGELRSVLDGNLPWVTAGAVAPDMPYLSYLNAVKGGRIETNWADIMHYHQTNGIVNLGVRTLAIHRQASAWEAKLAWLCGFASHLIADATVHPVVERIVGPCTDPDTMSGHHACENFQDTFIMQDILNMNVTESEYISFLRSCRSDARFAQVMTFWSEHARVACPVFGAPDPEAWFASYKDLLDTADGGNAIWKFFRHSFNVLYKSPKELRDSSPALCRKYYDDVPLPDGTSGPFKDRVFHFAARNIAAKWKDIESAVFLPAGREVAELLPNWNLDNGIDQTKSEQTYWA